MSDRIAQDLHRKISDQLDELLKREFRIAGIVLPHTEVILIYMQIAAQFGASAIGTAIGSRKADADPAALYDTFAEALAKSVVDRKAATLRAVTRAENAA